MDPLAASLARSPELFPLVLDPATDQLTFIRLSEADYQRASFLDARVLTPKTPQRALHGSIVEAAVAALPVTANYIFHIGHVGSTLLSRLLGSRPEVFALREPAILRTFAHMRFDTQNPWHGWSDAEFDARLGTVLKLLSRTFRPEQRALVKTTSFVSELARQILARPDRPRAIFIFVPAETYLATILGASNSPKEARLLAESRLARLHARSGGAHWRLPDLSEGEMVAMSWACEVAVLAAAAEEAKDQVLWLNFDEFLEDPARWLDAAFTHIGIGTASAQISAILSGPDMGRYAKAPEHPYDARLRGAVLRDARRDRARQIAKGLRWLKEAEIMAPALQQVFTSVTN
jgi:hypothetical protein